MAHLRTFRGRSIPLGATALADGVNFALLCRHGTKVRLVLLPVDSEDVIGEIALDPVKNRTGDHWHVLVAGLPHVFRYGWRVDGPKGSGHRFNIENILLDPSSTAIADGSTWSPVAHKSATKTASEPTPSSNGAVARRSLFVRRPYDWYEDSPPLTALEDSI